MVWPFTVRAGFFTVQETIGSALTSLAASILIYRLTGGSALSVGLMLMATAAPSLLVGLFAGVFVDRYDRKKIMMVADIVRGLLVLLIPVLAPLSVVWLYVIVALTSAIGQFFDPAYESVLPEVASDEELAAANSLIAISSFGSTAIGFAASGLIASAADISWAFYFDAVSFGFSATCVYLMRLRHSPVEEETSASLVVRNLQAGVRELFRTPILRSLFVLQIAVFIAGGLPNSLLLPFARRALGATEFEYGIQEALTSVAFVIASLLLAGMFDRMREGAWMLISYIGMATAGVVYSFMHSIPLAILALLVALVQGVLPILGTKSDDVEGPGRYTAIVVRLAGEYSVPLWDFRVAAATLSDNGLMPDRVHLTWGPDYFDDPAQISTGWQVRNLTALQMLDAVWRAVR